MPKAQPSDELSWAVDNPNIASAFAGFAEAVDSAGADILPDDVRSLVEARIQAWNGAVMGMSRRWVEDIANQAKPEHRAAIRLTLLTALASYQVDENTIQKFREQYPNDARLRKIQT